MCTTLTGLSLFFSWTETEAVIPVDKGSVPSPRPPSAGLVRWRSHKEEPIPQGLRVVLGTHLLPVHHVSIRERAGVAGTPREPGESVSARAPQGGPGDFILAGLTIPVCMYNSDFVMSLLLLRVILLVKILRVSPAFRCVVKG